ncbi:MAG: c-type cytochrome [Acidobacteriota bacterium]
MRKCIRTSAIVALALSMAGATTFAQSSGDAIYKAKCQMCHGATGTPNPGMAKMMGIKAVSDPAVKKMTLAQVEATVKNGKNKMRPISGLSDAQVKAVAEYFKSLK